MPDNPSKQEREGAKESLKKEQPDACPITECGYDTQVGKRCTDLDSECSEENSHIWNPCFEQQQGVRYITVSCIVSKDSHKQLSCDFTKNGQKQLCRTPETCVNPPQEIDIKKEEQQTDQEQVQLSEYDSPTQIYNDTDGTNYNNDNDVDCHGNKDNGNDDYDSEGMSLVIDQNDSSTSMEYNKSPSNMSDTILQLNSDTQVVKKSRGGGKVGRRRRRTYVYNPKPLISKPKSVPVSDDKDFEYWNKRMRNNDAAKRSRENRRIKEIETLAKVKKLSKQNEELKARINELENKNKYLESLLCKRSETENF